MSTTPDNPPAQVEFEGVSIFSPRGVIHKWVPHNENMVRSKCGLMFDKKADIKGAQHGLTCCKLCFSKSVAAEREKGANK